MLVDTQKLPTTEEPRTVLDHSPSDYERRPDIFVFRITWEGEEEGDLQNYVDTLRSVNSFPNEGEKTTEEDVRRWLDSGRRFRIGPDEDFYWVTPLQEPMTKDRWGELCLLSELDERNEDFEPPFDCRPGIDFPASL